MLFKMSHWAHPDAGRHSSSQRLSHQVQTTRPDNEPSRLNQPHGQ